MKKFLLAGLMFAVACSAFADGYVGVVRSKGKIAYKCNDSLSCKDSAELLRAYAGTKLSAENQVDIGVAKLDSIEIGYFRGVKPSARGLVTQAYWDPVDDVYIPPSDPANTNYVPVKFTIGFDALTVAGVVRANLADDFGLAVRVGVAYVTATKKFDYAGQSSKASSASKFKPYLGVSLDYNVLDRLKLLGVVDISQYEVDGTKGAIRAVGIGAEYAY